MYQATKYVLGKLEDGFVPPATAAKTGKESLAERWILHKFTIAAKEMNAALTQREFSAAASIVYQYWYTCVSVMKRIRRTMADERIFASVVRRLH